MLSSTVSSIILGSIAKKEGIHFEDTLTGFKWMGSRAKELIDQGKKVIFAFEEAIGFMYGSNVLDKDGVSAAAVMAEMINSLQDKNISLNQQLGTLYKFLYPIIRIFTNFTTGLFLQLSNLLIILKKYLKTNRSKCLL